MGLSTTPFCLVSLTLIFMICFVFFPSVKTDTDYSTLDYKGCSKQLFSDPTGVFSQTLSTLFASLVSQSSKTKYFKTTSGESQNSISGLFQCRGDLSNGDCYSCISKLPDMLNRLCGETVAARIQLSGCSLRYEIAGYQQISGFELLYKTCGSSQAAGSGFEEQRDSAFAAVESGVVIGSGFYTTSYESVYVLAQCDGDLGIPDCGECVKSAVQKAQVECKNSISGQIYLHKCYINYSYYPNGVPRESSSGTGQNSGKTIAVVLGGAAGVGFVVICLMFFRSLLKKRDDY